MKRKNSNLLLLGIFIGMLVFAFVTPANAATTTFTYEKFGSPDANTVNPYSNTGELPYTYAEHGWSGGTAAVDANSRFYVNTSDSGVDGSANFTFNTSTNYDYFEFRFMYLNTWSLHQNHSAIDFVVAGTTGTICTIKVTGANTSIDTKNRVKVLDYNDVEVANETIEKDKWYTVRINPDYDAWDLNAFISVYDITGATYVVAATTEVGLGGNSDMSKFYMEDAGTESVCINVDNLLLATTTLSVGESTTNYLTEYIFPILFALALLVAVIGFALAGADVKSLITVVILGIVGIVALMIISAL